MCGIVGYIGTCQAAPVLLDGLSKLEYRGYDSAGIAVYDGNKIQMQKAMGRLKVLEEMTQNGATLPGTVGIGHTRWATHGAPSDLNAHPHFNKDHSIVVVHNGIIENYLKLKKKLMSKGYEFLSETDTEVIAHMLDYYYNGDPLATITKVMHRMEGSYALGILFRDHPDEVYAVRKDSPLIVGTSKSGNLIASDVPAVLKYTRDVYFLENEEIVKLLDHYVTILDAWGQRIFYGFWLLMHLFQHKMLIDAFLCGIHIPFDVRRLLLQLLLIDIVKMKAVSGQLDNLLIFQKIDISCIFQYSRNVGCNQVSALTCTNDHKGYAPYRGIVCTGYPVPRPSG